MRNPIFDENDHINEAGCLAVYDNNYDFYASVLEVFVSSSKRELEELERYRKDGDKEAYRTIVHGLKSSAASVGADELAAFATKWDDMWKTGNRAVISLYHEELIEMYSDTAGMISDRLNRD